MSGARLAVNVVGFQVAWFALVLGAAAGRVALGIAIAVLAVAAHLALSPAPMREAQALFAVALLGTVSDSLPVALGWIEYRGAAPAGFAAPYWIAALWLAFATTLNGSLRPLLRRPWLAALLGAGVGPLCYLAAEGLGALTFAARGTGLAAQAMAWALLLPATLHLAAAFVSPRGMPVGEGAHV